MGEHGAAVVERAGGEWGLMITHEDRERIHELKELRRFVDFAIELIESEMIIFDPSINTKPYDIILGDKFAITFLKK